MKKEYTEIQRDAASIAEYMYKIVPEMPEEERWAIANKIKNSSTDLLFFTAQAVGNIAPATAEHDWGYVHKYANALKESYKFASKQGFVELDPQIMLLVERIIKKAEVEAGVSKKSREELNDNELDSWREKHRIWKEIQK